MARLQISNYALVSLVSQSKRDPNNDYLLRPDDIFVWGELNLAKLGGGTHDSIHVHVGDGEIHHCGRRSFSAVPHAAETVESSIAGCG